MENKMGIERSIPNPYYELIAPATKREYSRFFNKKLIITLIVGILITCGMGIHYNYETLQEYIPSLNFSQTTHNNIYSSDNHSVSLDPINYSLINPSYKDLSLMYL